MCLFFIILKPKSLSIIILKMANKKIEKFLSLDYYLNGKLPFNLLKPLNKNLFPMDSLWYWIYWDDTKKGFSAIKYKFKSIQDILELSSEDIVVQNIIEKGVNWTIWCEFALFSPYVLKKCFISETQKIDMSKLEDLISHFRKKPKSISQFFFSKIDFFNKNDNDDENDKPPEEPQLYNPIPQNLNNDIASVSSFHVNEDIGQTSKIKVPNEIIYLVNNIFSFNSISISKSICCTAFELLFKPYKMVLDTINSESLYEKDMSKKTILIDWNFVNAFKVQSFLQLSIEESPETIIIQNLNRIL